MKYIAYSIALLAFVMAAFSTMLAIQTASQQTHLFNSATDYPDYLLSHSYAVLVSTNLVSRPCPCGVCDPDKGIAVLEHMNVIGYDLEFQVSTNYLPIVSKPL